MLSSMLIVGGNGIGNQRFKSWMRWFAFDFTGGNHHPPPPAFFSFLVCGLSLRM